MARAHADISDLIRGGVPERTLEPMENRILNRMTVLQVLDYDSLQQLGSDIRVPDSLGVYNHDWPIAAHAEARRFPALHAVGSEQKIFALQQVGEQGVKPAPSTIRRAKISGANENVAGVPFHLRFHRRGHSPKIKLRGAAPPSASFFGGSVSCGLA